MANQIPIDAYVGFSEIKLLQLKSDLEDLVTAEGDIVRTQTKDLSVDYKADDVSAWEKMRAVRYALWKLNPDQYAQPDAAKVKRYYTT